MLGANGEPLQRSIAGKRKDLQRSDTVRGFDHARHYVTVSDEELEQLAGREISS
jgi:hypothetical protein